MLAPTGGNVGHHVDAVAVQEAGRAHAGELQELRRVDGPAAADHLTGVHGSAAAALGVGDAGGPVALEEDPGGEGPGDEVEVGPLEHRVQVGLRRAQAPAPVDVAVEGGEALLAVAVDIGGPGVAGLLGGFQEGLEQGVGGRPPLQHQRAPVAAVGAPAAAGGRAAVVVTGQALFHALEVGQAVGVVPALHAGVGGPALVVEGVAPLEDHAVDAGRAAQHLAPGVVDAAPAHVGLGLGGVLPVVEAVADGERQGCRHVYVHVEAPVPPARLQHEHRGGRVGAEPVGQRAASRAPAHDHVVVTAVSVCHGHLMSSHRVRRLAPCRATIATLPLPASNLRRDCHE